VSNFYAGAYWGARRESAIECAERLSDCLTALAGVDPCFSMWCRKGGSKASPLRASVDAASWDELAALLTAGRNRRDTDKGVISELGFNAALWNCNENSIASFRVTCGAYIDNPAIKNVFVLQLPEFTGDAAGLGHRISAIAVVKALVESWDPDWATWSSHDWRSTQTVDAAKPVFGLATYVARRSDNAVPVPGVRAGAFAAGVLYAFDAEREEVSSEQTAALQAYVSRA
jgi:hypothetical protein